VSVLDGKDIDSVRDLIRKAVVEIPFVQVRTWREEKASLLRAVGVEKTVVGIILGVLILFAGFMIFIVLTVQVVEKTRDLGILQSLGATSLGIASIYFLIGAGVCLAGTLLGAVVGVAFSLGLDTIQRWIYLLVGFDLFPRTVYYIDRIPVRLAPWDILFIIAPTVLASLLASVVPALRAARKDPVVALRYE
jgi:lipoprotein-releasing system permease protein